MIKKFIFLLLLNLATKASATAAAVKPAAETIANLQFNLFARESAR